LIEVVAPKVGFGARIVLGKGGLAAKEIESWGEPEIGIGETPGFFMLPVVVVAVCRRRDRPGAHGNGALRHRRNALPLQAFIPASAAALLDLLGVVPDARDFAQAGEAHALAEGAPLRAPKPIFPRYVEEESAG
jgi:hypothetical protein